MFLCFESSLVFESRDRFFTITWLISTTRRSISKPLVPLQREAMISKTEDEQRKMAVIFRLTWRSTLAFGGRSQRKELCTSSSICCRPHSHNRVYATPRPEIICTTSFWCSLDLLSSLSSHPCNLYGHKLYMPISEPPEIFSAVHLI